MNIQSLKTHNEIAQSFDIFLELRPHLANIENFTTQITDQQKEGYEIIAVYKDNEIAACLGFRFLTTLAWGKIIYIDDLVTKKKYQQQGYSKILLDYVIQVGRDNFCNQIHLDTGYSRHDAHKVYLKKGFEFHSHHLIFKLE
jgi:GNAT superfamily N-acetyltransferase